MKLAERGDDAWYESEESTRAGMVAELQRLKRRTLARPLPVIALGALLAAVISYKIVTRKPTVEAEIVLLLTEGSLSSKHNDIPVDTLKEYVSDVLLPNDKLAELAKRRGLDRLGRMDDTITDLREQLDIRIWKNTFVYYDADAEAVEHSARIGLTVTAHDPDTAYQRVNDFAQIIITTANEIRRDMTAQLVAEIAELRKVLERELGALTRERGEKSIAMAEAKRAGRATQAQALQLGMIEIDSEMKIATKRLSDIAQSNDTIADRIAEAGLDMGVQIVENNRPSRSEQHGFLVALIVAVIAFGSLLGAAFFVGAFDSRVADTDDVARLGLDVLGHVPGFPGDDVGSLRARGVTRRRVPSWSRWRSHQ